MVAQGDAASSRRSATSDSTRSRRLSKDSPLRLMWASLPEMAIIRAPMARRFATATAASMESFLTALLPYHGPALPRPRLGLSSAATSSVSGTEQPPRTVSNDRIRRRLPLRSWVPGTVDRAVTGRL